MVSLPSFATDSSSPVKVKSPELILKVLATSPSHYAITRSKYVEKTHGYQKPQLP
jgi:hypothetical protein